MQSNTLTRRQKALSHRIERLVQMADAKAPGDPKVDGLIRQIEKLNIELQAKD